MVLILACGRAGSISALLARLNLTPQKPLQRADQCNKDAIERWQRDLLPY